MWFAGTDKISPRRVWLARAIAVLADLTQLALFPFFGEGFLSPVNDVLDVVTCVASISLVGWHIAFLPTFIVKELPLADLAPTWTIAVLIATRGRMQTPASQTDAKLLPPANEVRPREIQ